MTYVTPEVTLLAPAIRVIESSFFKLVPIIADQLRVVFATDSAYEADE